jgi:inorganic phosphate transporter, PiT family
LAAIIIAAAIFSTIAGFNDGGNLLAIAASSRTIPPAAAYLLLVASVCAGPIVAGTAVARTTGAGIADFHAVGTLPLLAGIIGGIVAVLGAYAVRIPTSMSVALFASMVGALAVGPGIGAVHWLGVEKVAIAQVASIAAGAVGGFVAYALVAALLLRVHRRLGDRIMALQYATVALLGIGYGANDLEKSAGLLAAGSATASFSVPAWTVVVAVACFAAGMAVGGVRVAKTIGGKLFSIRSQSALACQFAAAVTVIAAALAGGPLSTTQTTASSLVGVGAAVNPREVHWLVAARIVAAWFVTAPIAIAAGALAQLALQRFV